MESRLYLILDNYAQPYVFLLDIFLFKTEKWINKKLYSFTMILHHR